MATLARLQARSSTVGNQYYFRNSVVDPFRIKENDAAVKIQSWFRGCQVRAYIRHLNRIVTIIQKWWRSFLGRKRYQLTVQVAYYTMMMNLYNAMAVRIQRRWRGYRVRKYLFNYYYLKEYLRVVSETNDAIRKALEEFAEMKEREEKKANLEREEKKRDYQARKMHYLLSTKQILAEYDESVKEQKQQEREPGETVQIKEDGYKKWMNSLMQVQIQFLPFSSYHKNEKYIPSMHLSSKYCPISHKEQFRSENPKKWICDKDFQTVLPSFELFSKYGKLYSKAGQIV
ncbi:PREDICTED: spermatogenesis-associated protein 17 [Colobus angolensis palliatus]|uniref:spermatogenesis-associated protein 17 n=1 Tax=Colobus angolensis palliatus TaxID=336983 RepID=UPI0005F518B7|nr:PREDICTED: spermatogenesis-associated protein 17 [Colobus angolensis palliatus]